MISLFLFSCKNEIIVEDEVITSSKKDYIRCDTFELQCLTDDNNIKIKLNTDLPEEVIIRLSIYREIFRKDNFYDRYEYFLEEKTVKELSIWNEYTISNSKWEKEVCEHINFLETINVPYLIEGVGGDICILASVELIKNSHLLGESFGLLIGNRVNKYSFNKIEDTVFYNHPFP